MIRQSFKGNNFVNQISLHRNHPHTPFACRAGGGRTLKELHSLYFSCLLNSKLNSSFLVLFWVIVNYFSIIYKSPAVYRSPEQLYVYFSHESPIYDNLNGFENRYENPQKGLLAKFRKALLSDSQWKTLNRCIW